MTNLGAQAFEDGIDLQIDLLEASMPESLNSWPSYPFLPLKRTSATDYRTFRTIVLENPLLKITVLPGMGGRILRVFDKRTGTEILQKHAKIEPQPGGRRGASVREGIQIMLDGEERLNSMGNVSCQIEHTADEDDAAAVWISETVTGTGLSFHMRLSLPPDAAELICDVRILNRWLRPQPYNGAISIYFGDAAFDGSTAYSAGRDAGIGVFSTGLVFDAAMFVDGRLSFARFPKPKTLAARQVDAWSFSLIPYSGLGGCFGASEHAAVSLVDGTLRIQSSRRRLNDKLLMLTDDGQTLEAHVDLHPEHHLEIPLGDLNPVEFVLLDPAKNEVLRTGITSDKEPIERSPGPPSFRQLTLEMDQSELQRATFDVSQRHLAHTLLGMQALAGSRFNEAGNAFEQALNFNADDPLLWWAKAVSARLADQDPEAELLNGHFLAPLEPALRAESFLSQPVNLDPEPNPLLSPLAENPEEFIEVACLLIEAGLFDQAGRWLDEAIRHRDLPMLRYLTAYCLVTKTKLFAEAAQHLRVAAQTPIGPPFPFRDLERKAIHVLRSAFPDDANLRVFASYLD